MGKAARNRRLRKETLEITLGHPGVYKGVYRRAKKLGNAAAVIQERIQRNAYREARGKKR